MDSHDLSAFLQVYNERSINKAAKSLFMSPQGLSKLISRLEGELECKLFTRSHSGVVPTRYAHVLRERSLRIGKSLENLKKEVQKVGSERLYELNVAATYGLFAYLTIDFVIDFKLLYPDISLIINEVPDVTVREMLDTEAAEIGFMGAPFDIHKYNGCFYTNHKVCVVINKQHPLATKKALTYQDLDQVPLAIEGRNFNSFHNIMNCFLKAGVQPNILMETAEIEFVHQIAAKGKGVGISVDFQAFAHPFPNTVILPLADPACTFDVCLLTKKGKLLSEAAQCFQGFATTWLTSHQKQLFHWQP